MALVSAAALSAHAASLISDDYSTYTAGNLVGQGNWLQTSTATATPIQVSGGDVVLGTSGQDAYKAFSSSWSHSTQTSLTSYLDLSVNTAKSGGDYFYHYGDSAGTVGGFFGRLYAKSTTGGFLLGLSGSSETAAYGTTVLSLSTAYSVKFVWNFVTGTLNDTFALYVNGSSTPYLTYTWGSTIAEPSQIVQSNYRQGTSSSAPSVSISSLEVVPEPTTFALLFGGIGLMLWMLRLKRLRA